MLRSVMGFGGGKERHKSTVDGCPLDDEAELGTSQGFGGADQQYERSGTELPTKAKASIRKMFKKKAADFAKQGTPNGRMSTVNIQRDLKDQVAWQHKPYCQICYAQFTRISLTPHHCRLCGRTCCKDCSGKRTVDVAIIQQLSNKPVMEEDLDASVISAGEGAQDGAVRTRICEYCEVKLDNPQID